MNWNFLKGIFGTFNVGAALAFLFSGPINLQNVLVALGILVPGLHGWISAGTNPPSVSNGSSTSATSGRNGPR